MKTRVLIYTIIVFFAQSSFANPVDSARVAQFHLSFITPLGTNGLDSHKTINHFSVNLFAGFSGGLEGIELGGFANGLKGDMRGVQVAGFCNNTFGNAEGAEIAGFWNYNHKNLKGIQAAGFVNCAIGDVDGIQASGFANIAVGEMKGVQASGFVNYASKLNGLQAGFVNFADTVESGFPVGFLSFVRDGYFTMEIGGNESLPGTVSLKTGVKRFYNIISLGASIRNDRLLWGWGYGIGTMFPVAAKLDMSVEAVSYHLNEDNWYSGNINMLNRGGITLSYSVNSYFSVFAGSSVNVWITNVDSQGDPYTYVPFDHWSWYSRTSNRTEVSIYPGLSAGIRIKMN